MSLDGVFRGSERDISSMISLAENNPLRARREMKLIAKRSGKAHIIGVTGPPGTGKSTLIHLLAKEFRKKNRKVGIILVDPSSAYTGGAILGDRIRMQELSRDKGIYIRSMGSRGTLGGISLATGDAVKILDASGKDIIIVETVGAGQGEIDVRRFAHTIILVGSPGMGDEIQAMKAGLMEIADIFVVNKSDRDGSDDAVREIECGINVGEEASGSKAWRPPVIKTKANIGEGIGDLVESIEKHSKYLRENGLFDSLDKRNQRDNVLALVKHTFDVFIEGKVKDKAIKRTTDIYSAAEEVCRKYIKGFR